MGSIQNELHALLITWHDWFVDGNAHKMQEWLQSVADGIQNDEGKYVVAPNPEKAFGMLQTEWNTMYLSLPVLKW